MALTHDQVSILLAPETEANWQQKAEIIKRIKDDKVKINQEIIKGITLSIKSERTRLARASMDLCLYIDSNIDLLLPVILNNCAKANNVYVSCALNTLVSLIDKGVPNLVLSLLPALSSINKVFRQSAALLLVHLIKSTCSNDLLSRSLLFESCVSLAIQDKDDLVRKSGRDAFSLLSKMINLDSFLFLI